MMQADEKYILNVYHRLPLLIRKGKGVYLYDEDNTPYLDMFSGIAVNSLGYNHPKINKAILKQLKRHLHLSNYFVSSSSTTLAKLLVENSFASKCFFTNSGTEANEAALKLARVYGKSINPEKYEIITMMNSFHGRTFGSLSLTGQMEKQKRFMPLLDKVFYVKRNDIEDLRNKVNNNTAAIFIELVQGEAGVQFLNSEYIEEIKKLSRDYNFLVIIDEIQSGLMRTGSLFTYQQFNINPDVMTIAKSLGGGLPLGAMLVNGKLERVLTYGDHGSTFGGNPLSCSGGVAFINEILKPKFTKQVQKNADYLIKKLFVLQALFSNIVKEVRGLGMMIGLEVGNYAYQIQEAALKRKILLNITNKTVIRLLPPLIINKQQIDLFLNNLRKILEDINVR
jgi:acetylornithine/N-succinyldiaminopimelate aminotransferase